jgi:hypothetical protein
LKKNTTCNSIIAGDWDQLEVVQDRAIFDYENSDAIHHICDGLKVELTHCRRADRELFDLYTNVENVKIQDFKNTLCKKSVCYHNSVRRKINKEWMEKLRGDKYFTILKCKVDKNSQDINVYKGLPIMACKTNKALDIVNGE